MRFGTATPACFFIIVAVVAVVVVVVLDVAIFLVPLNFGTRALRPQ